MEKFKRLFSVCLVVMLVVFGIIGAGCSKKEDVKPTGDNNNVQTSDDEFGEIEGNEEKAEKVLAIGEKGSNKSFKEISVSKITATKSLTSKEATALLQRGEPGESPENSVAPAKGNEFLMITFSFKGNKAQTVITPSVLTLNDKEDKTIIVTTTNGQGGIFNMKPVEASKESKITAVYEVPEGKTGFVLTFEPFGDEEIKFNIR